MRFNVVHHAKIFHTIPFASIVGFVVCSIQFFSNPVATVAQYPVIELMAVTPTAAQVGTTIDLKVTSGNNLEAIDRLYFSDPRITSEVVREPVAADAGEGAVGAIKSGEFKVTVPQDLPPGRYEVRAGGAYGISNPRVFVVTPHKVVKPQSVSQSQSEPTAIDDQMVDGAVVLAHQATAARVDYLRFTGNAKGMLRVSIDAQRIDSRMIPQLRLFDDQGRLLNLVRGTDGHDPSLVVPAQSERPFTVAINDFLFRGGPNYFYQLRIEPIDEAAVDPRTTSGILAPTATADAKQLDQHDLLEFAAIHQSVMAMAPDSISWLTIQPGADPIKLSPPCQVVSLFPAPIVARPQPGKSTDHHAYEFDAEQGRRYTIEVIAQRLGQPTDPRLTIVRREVKPDMSEVWHAVASEDDPPVVGDAALRIRSRDPIVGFTAPATATYRIRVSNIDSGGSLAIKPAYRLVIREVVPDFSLIAIVGYPHNDPAQSRPFGTQLMRGDSLTIRVLANRRDGFAAPIAVSINGLPEGVSARPVTIASNQSEATLVVRASESCGTWSGPIEVVGKSEGDAQPIVASAMPAAFIWGSGDQRDFIRARLANDLVIAVTDQQVAPMSIKLVEKTAEPPAEKPVDQAAESVPAGVQASAELTLSSKPGTNVSFAVQVDRREGGAGAITLRPKNLPPGVTAADLAIAADKSDGVIELKIAADAKPGFYSLWFMGETKVKFKPITQNDPRELTVFIPSTSANLELTATP